MLKYVSTTGGGPAVDFEKAILDGFAEDGGLYVPEHLPQISEEQLSQWIDLSYTDLAFEVLSLFIDKEIINSKELKDIINLAYSPFEKDDVIPIYKLNSRTNTFIMELFYGPTLSFKDIGLAFLVTLVDFFLARKKEHLNIIVATTGDTGPATAYFAAGKPTLTAWVLFPDKMITVEQERQMTTLQQANIHAIRVANCIDGGDDLDVVRDKLFEDTKQKERLRLSSVNSINWGRIMMQTVHYFYGYLKVVDRIGERINISVPSGGFGNMCAGGLAREMGLPVETFICANNKNACLHRIFSKGLMTKEDIHETPSSAMDILIPINFWRYLYFIIGKDSEKIKNWATEFNKTGIIQFEQEVYNKIKSGVFSESVSNEETISIIRDVFMKENYLLDPHGAVALAASGSLEMKLNDNKLICLSTAHPAKFPEIIISALQDEKGLPEAGTHISIEEAKSLPERAYSFDMSNLEEELILAMERNLDLKKAL